jgi:hypothetical protein
MLLLLLAAMVARTTVMERKWLKGAAQAKSREPKTN